MTPPSPRPERTERHQHRPAGAQPKVSPGAPAGAFPVGQTDAHAPPAPAPEFFTTAARWALWGLLLILPIAVWPKITALVSTYLLVKMALLGYGCAVVLGLSALSLAFHDGSARRAGGWIATPAAWGMIGLAAAILLSTLTAAIPAYSLNQTWILLCPLGVAMACGWILPSERTIRLGTRLMVAGGLAVALIGMADSAGILPLFKTLYGKTPEDLLLERGAGLMRGMQGGLGRGRMLSTLGNPAYVGGFLVIPTLLLLGELLNQADLRRRAKLPTLLGAAALGVLVLAMVLTSTREAFLGVAVGVAGWGVVLWRRRKRTAAPASRDYETSARLRPGWILGGLLAGLVVILVVFSTPNPLNPAGWNVASRFVELTDPRSDSIRERLLFYTLAGRMFAERPLLGWGPGMFGVRFYPTLESYREEGPAGPWSRIITLLDGRVAEFAHNDLVQLAVEGGVVSLGMFLWMIAAMMVLLRRVVTAGTSGAAAAAGGLSGETGPPSLVPVLFCAWFGALTTLLTSFPLHTPTRALYFWVLTGMLLALGIHLRPTRSKGE